MYEWAAQLIRLVKTHQRFHTVNWVLGSRSHEKVCTLDTWPAKSMAYLILWIMFEREFKKKKKAHRGLAFKETVTPLFKRRWQARGKGPFRGSEGTGGGEEGTVFLFWFHNTDIWSFHSLVICLVCVSQPPKALFKKTFLHQKWLQWPFSMIYAEFWKENRSSKQL